VVRWLLRMGADVGIRGIEPFEGVDMVGTAGNVARVVGDEAMVRLAEEWDIRRGERKREVWRLSAEDGDSDCR
jgi:hypothetical protein